MVLGGVNVGDDSGDDLVGFREQFQIVAAEDGEIAEALSERKRGAHFLAEFRAGDIRPRRRIAAAGFDRLEQLPVTLDAAARYSVLADQKEEEQPRNGEKEDNQQPRHG